MKFVMSKRRLLQALVVVVGVFSLTPIASFAASVAPTCTLIVSAAASLTSAFKQLASHFEQQQHCQVLLNFGASGSLVQQLAHGAPVDVIATADQISMDLATEQQLITERHDFIGNQLVLLLAKHQAALKQLTDLKATTVKQIAIGNPALVPAGRYAKHLLEQQQLWAELQEKLIPATHVKQVLEYVLRAEVDAGFVYQSDLVQAKTTLSDLPLALAEPIRYPVAIASRSQQNAVAQQFIAFLLSTPAQQLLQNQGFTALAADN